MSRIDLVGESLGDFDIVAPLGEGNMARVYRAVRRSDGQPVALKVIRRVPGEGQELVARFQREKAVMQKLTHPNILPIYDYASNADFLWIAMLLVEDGTLESWLKNRGALSPDQAILLLSQLGAALDCAHGQGVIHRDLKPANVLMQIGQVERLYLSDFGVARLVEEQGLTRPGMAMGTPEYISPEQLAGAKVDGRADQYALAVLAYQMLTGQPPFQGALPEILRQHMTSIARAPSQLKAGLPKELDQVVLRGLAKKPENRYARAGDFVRALAESLESHTTPQPAFHEKATVFVSTKQVSDAPLSQPPPSRPQMARPGTRSAWKTWFGLAVLIALCLAAFAAGRGWKPAFKSPRPNASSTSSPSPGRSP